MRGTVTSRPAQARQSFGYSGSPARTEQGTINTRLRLEETMNTNRDRERRRQGAGADRIWHAHAYLS